MVLGEESRSHCARLSKRPYVCLGVNYDSKRARFILITLDAEAATFGLVDKTLAQQGVWRLGRVFDRATQCIYYQLRLEADLSLTSK